jgi:hypothetical protein
MVGSPPEQGLDAPMKEGQPMRDSGQVPEQSQLMGDLEQKQGLGPKWYER